MKNQNSRLISPFAAGSLNTLITLIDVMLIKKIPSLTIQNDIHALLAPIKKTIMVLSDLEANNDEQLKQVWLEFVQSSEFNNSFQSRIAQAVSLIEDEKAKAFISKIVKPCIETITALYDQNPDNVQQIAETWKNFAADKSNIQSIIHFFIKDESLCEDVAVILENLFDNLKAVMSKDNS